MMKPTANSTVRHFQASNFIQSRKEQSLTFAKSIHNRKLRQESYGLVSHLFGWFQNSAIFYERKHELRSLRERMLKKATYAYDPKA